MLKEDAASGRYQIQSYEPGRVKINGAWYSQSVALTAQSLDLFTISNIDDVDETTIEYLCQSKPEIVLLGTGPKHEIPPASLTQKFLKRGIGVECMDSRTACGTFTVLLSEGRQVVAMILI